LLAGVQNQSGHYTTPLTLEEMQDKQAVVETSAGPFIIELRPELAPNHAGYFMKLAEEGAYDGTTFHRMVKYGIIQGGDPLSKDPEQADRYGQGGLGILRAEPNEARHVRGAVSAVLRPGDRDSAGAQFFVCIVDQPGLDGSYTVFGQVVEGMDVVQKISETPTDEKGRALERVEILSVTLRDKPPPEPEPFSTETVEELADYRAVLETSLGSITIELLPEKAPEHVRNFLRLASVGAYDGNAFHRIVPGFVIQTGSLATRVEPLTEKITKYVRNLAPEFNDTPHVLGTVSMARGDDPASASTSFFICTGDAHSLDGKYTAFGQVVEGLDIVAAIEAVPTEGEEPLCRVELVRVRLEKAPR
ncbi:MAG: peptidylprolyl isomerase, partial [Acidobacteriota bacterium]